MPLNRYMAKSDGVSTSLRRLFARQAKVKRKLALSRYYASRDEQSVQESHQTVFLRRGFYVQP